MHTSDTSLLVLLQALEVELHTPAARGDEARLARLLHDDFREFGRSGAIYTKADTLAQLPAEIHHAVIVADLFVLRRLGDAAALLTYRAANQGTDGTFDRFTLRTSVWEHSSTGWQMSFHQGTPTAPYRPGDAAAGDGE